MPRTCSPMLRVLIACLLPFAVDCKGEKVAKPGVDLPVVQLPASSAPQPGLRILVRANGIDVDNSAVVDSWPREKRDRFLSTLEPDDRESVPLIEHEVVRLSSGRVTGVDLLADWPGLRQVRQVIDAALEMERRFHREMLPEVAFAPQITMSIDRSVPYDTVARVLSVVTQSGVEQHWFEVRAGQGKPVQVLATAPPGRVTLVGCGIPRMTVVDQGLAIELVPRFDVPGPARRQLVGPRRECPSVPRREDHIDMAGADALLEHVEVLRACPEALIGAEGSRPWGEVAQAAAAALRAGRTVVQYFLATPEFSSELSGCKEAVECPGPECPSSLRTQPLPQGGRPPVHRPPR